MYKATVRALMRYSITKLNHGDASLLLRLARPEAVICFPGNNSWAAMYRPVVKNRAQHVTHDGIEECKGFADRFVDEGIQFEIEDILVNGPPWNTRVALRVQSFKPGRGATDDYNNRAIALLTTKWGRLVSWEDYEDTERGAAWDASRASAMAATTQTT